MFVIYLYFTFNRPVFSDFAVNSSKPSLRRWQWSRYDIILLIDVQLTIGSYVSVRSSRYEARGKFREHERCVRVALGYASMNTQLTYEPIVL